MDKVIRTICLFTNNPTSDSLTRISQLTDKLTSKDFIVQTRRLCSNNIEGVFDLDYTGDGSIFLSLGKLTFDNSTKHLDRILNAKNIAFNLDLTKANIDASYVSLLTAIIDENASKTFNFSYTYNNLPSSPFYPSAVYEKNGFSLGLQPTDLSEGCKSIDEWLENMKLVWEELDNIFALEKDFLGIDTSIAPLFEGKGSFINFIKRLDLEFSKSVTTDNYLKITNYINNKYYKTVGLCGLMFPCLEDFELALEYEEGNFSIERNVFLSLHSGLGIDTYPISIDEKPERILDILKLLQELSNKYKKPLSARFVSDGKAKIGELTNFQNQYLKDVEIRPL